MTGSPGCVAARGFLRPSVSAVIEDRKIRTSFIQRLPLAKKHYSMYLSLFPLAVERFDLKGYGLVISLSHCVARDVITSP